VLFEFGPTREADLAGRRVFLAWQPRLRLVFLTRVALLKYRLALPGFQLPPNLAAAQADFDRELAKRIDQMADRLEGKSSPSDDALEQSFARLETVSREHRENASPELAAPFNGVLLLSRRIERLTTGLDQEVGSQPAA
jgi:multidrug resistance protein MdtO